MTDTSIEWTGKTWNPTRGCSLASPGCTNCYAMRQAHRSSTTPGMPYYGLTRAREHGGPVWNGILRMAPSDTLEAPLHWRDPQTIFVNSMSDLFHENLANDQIAAVFGVMAACPQHTFQVLTKRAKRMHYWFSWLDGQCRDSGYSRVAYCIRAAMERGADIGELPQSVHDAITADSWPLPNVHLGVSVEDQVWADDRVPWLLRTTAAIRFVSYEPALGRVDFTPWLTTTVAAREVHNERGLQEFEPGLHRPRLDWVIVGGESGPNSRRFQVEWARAVVQACRVAGVSVFVKQLGRDPHIMPELCRGWVPLRLKSKKGNKMDEWPEDLRVREFPRRATQAAA